MPAAQLRPTLAAPDVETALAALRAHGMRVSTARRQIVEALFAAEGPLPAEALGAPPASVYGNLEVLERLGLVRHVHLGHGPALWMLADRTRTEFLRCERCGATQAVAPSELQEARDAIRAATGFRAWFTHFPIVGLCRDCAET